MSDSIPAVRLAPSGPIDSLRFVGTGHAVPLSTAQASVTIGAADCDVIVPSAISAAVATHQATLTRWLDTSALSVRDRGATEQRVVQPGGVFWLGSVPVLAMDQRLEWLRRLLAWCLGLDRHDAIDEAIEVLAEARPIALVSADGLDVERLVKAIHRVSPQRAGRLLSIAAAPLPALVDTYGATVCIDLRAVRVLTAPVARRLFDRARGLRPIFIARDERSLRSIVDDYADRIRTLRLRPLAQRRDEIVRLLAILWRKELKTDRRVGELGRAANGLASHRWPGNLDELRENAPRLLAYVEHRGVRPAARALGIAHQTLGGHFDRIGFESGLDRRDGRDPRRAGLVPGVACRELAAN